ncbi:MAG: DUF6259 domain-containing protein [Victivallaceae bacterium]|nr:DUF6259 domain-containing protein [Victivallaceae bacterium]
MQYKTSTSLNLKSIISVNRWLIGSFIFIALIVFAPCLVSAQQYNPVSTTISIPSGYTEMLVPAYHGKLLATGAYSSRYPSTYHNMQLMAFRNPATNQIFYVQTQDPNGQVIDWAVAGSSGSYNLTLTIFSLSSTFPANFYITDTTMTAATHREFYRTVARKYKAWAINQQWAKRKKSAIDNMATMAIAPDLRQVTMDNTVFPYIDAWNGEQTGSWITFWRKYWRYGIDGALPDYRLGGNATESLSSLSQLATKNSSSFPYTNALLWDSNIIYTSNPQTQLEIDMNEIWTNNPSARYNSAEMIKNSSGQVVAYSNNTHMKYICQASAVWKTTFVNACKTMAGDGWQGIYYDMAAFTAPILCYAANHTHDAGDPLVWQDGIRDILSTLESDNQTKELLILTEGNAEIYMDLVDAFLSYAETGVTDSNNPLRKQVPLFREVYGDIARFIGWQLFPAAIPQETVNDLTPTIMNDAIIKAANFGSLCYAAPYFIGWSASIDAQNLLASDAAYATIFDKINNPLYKRVYEAGGGAGNWILNGTAPAAVNVVDSETGAAAVQFGITNRDGGANYQLDINETSFFNISWDMKISNSYYILVTVAASDGYWYNLLYDQHDRNYRVTAVGTIKIGLGSNTFDGTWRTIHRDLADDLYQANGKTITKVIKFLVYANGLVDSIALSNAPYIYEDGIDASDWSISGSGLSTSSVTDSETGSAVIQLSGITNRDSGKSFTKTLGDSQRFDMVWDMKTSMSYYVIVTVAASDGYWYNLLYDQHNRDYRVTSGTTVKIGLGADSNDGTWHTFRRNLADDLYEGTGQNITNVIKMIVYAEASIDNVLLWGNGIRTSGSR